jgi:predicted metal-dependent enzyme (double-stranded beta helix superfamily)
MQQQSSEHQQLMQELREIRDWMLEQVKKEDPERYNQLIEEFKREDDFNED